MYAYMFEGVQHPLLLFVYQMVSSKVVFISPMLFNVYIDQLSIRLNWSGRVEGDMEDLLINYYTQCRWFVFIVSLSFCWNKQLYS